MISSFESLCRTTGIPINSNGAAKHQPWAGQSGTNWYKFKYSSTGWPGSRGAVDMSPRDQGRVVDTLRARGASCRHLAGAHWGVRALPLGAPCAERPEFQLIQTVHPNTSPGPGNPGQICTNSNTRRQAGRAQSFGTETVSVPKLFRHRNCPGTGTVSVPKLFRYRNSSAPPRRQGMQTARVRARTEPKLYNPWPRPKCFGTETDRNRA